MRQPSSCACATAGMPHVTIRSPPLLQTLLMMTDGCVAVAMCFTCCCSPLCHETAARPRTRPVPAAPAWLKQMLGADAEAISNACIMQDAPLGEQGVEDPLLDR
jgi:hypothetical protein